MKQLFLTAPWQNKITFPQSFIQTIKKTHKKGTLAIYSSIQFLEQTKTLFPRLKKEGYNPITSTPCRACEKGQILGCDSYEDSLKLPEKEIQGFIYIGDGLFHPYALLYAQENQPQTKPVIVFNPITQKTTILTQKHIEKNLKKRKANLAKFHMSKTIGVFISSKWGQEHLQSALKLKKMYQDKQFYFFIADNFNPQEMENFPFIECWVNTACPRIAQDDILNINKPITNIKDIWQK